MLTLTMGATVWVLASAAVSGAVVRLILGVLAVHAARSALRPSDPVQSAQRLAVLRAVLKGVRSRGR
ncbi:hypothetical protein [Actinacidiphila bryophytorum]|uniref:Uncharacterized protein n=1 Tax=Actinacidiphila bryophytorum TaxID=1436133 RepID=A0A9W4MFD5_9ACTN|nr:hypothetical protein [Actinacidiphila bryophytorum]MBM9434994.1 hypothetical protein [Actinacidiphila bryophytorum]MBN6544529.1 hypothetical protein [Actinacidiphila bryophytorum]CAG7642196.1 conserved hypothetical protein [Actinacidiphila bryophytorum]